MRDGIRLGESEWVKDENISHLVPPSLSITFNIINMEWLRGRVLTHHAVD